jgi:hypothetical protein
MYELFGSDYIAAVCYLLDPVKLENENMLVSVLMNHVKAAQCSGHCRENLRYASRELTP